MGIRPGWQARVSIRGKKLGARRSFSGGRGLQPGRKGAYGEDAVAVLDNLSPVMAVRHAEKEFKAKKVTGDRLGFHHVRIKQLHQGLRVVGGDLMVHFDKSDEAYQVNGTYVPGIGVDTAPEIDADAAVQVALKDLAGLGQEPDRLQGAPELVVFAQDRAPVLAYEILFSSLPDGSQASGAWRYWIDARTGEVIVRYNDVKDIAAPTSNGYYEAASGKILSGEGGGTEQVPDCWWDDTNEACYLYNKVRKWFIFNDSDSSTYYPDAETYAHRTSYDWGESDPVEMSGAMNFDATQTYFENVHGRNSYDNTNTYAHAN